MNPGQPHRCKAEVRGPLGHLVDSVYSTLLEGWQVQKREAGTETTMCPGPVLEHTSKIPPVLAQSVPGTREGLRKFPGMQFHMRLGLDSEDPANPGREGHRQFQG